MQHAPFETNAKSLAVLCRTPGELLAAAWERESLAGPGARAFPVLGGGPHAVRPARGPEPDVAPYRPSPLADRLERMGPDALLDWAAERTAAAPPGRVCVVRRGDEAAVAGAAHALASGRRLRVAGAEGVARAADGAESCVLVLSPPSLARTGLDALRDAMEDATGAWGVLTASDPARLSSLLARLHLRAPAAERRGAVFRSAPAGFLSLREPGLRERELPHHPDPGALRPLTDEGLPFAAFVGHGRPYCALGGNLCSREAPAEAGDPRCVDGYACAFPQAPRVPAGRLRADFALLDSCFTSAFGTRGPNAAGALNLAVRLLDGHAVAVLSPWRTSTPLYATPYLAWSLAGRGWSAGQIAAALNALARARLDAPSPYLLLGDPDTRIFAPPAAATPHADVETDAAGAWRIRLPGDAGGVRALRVHLPGGGAPARMGTARTRPQAPLHAEVLPAGPDGAQAELLVLGGAPGGCLELAPAPRALARARTAAALLDNLRLEGPWSGEAPARAALQAALREAERALLAAGAGPVAEAPLWGALATAERELKAGCRAASLEHARAVLAYAAERQLWPLRAYAGRPGVRRMGIRPRRAPCTRCGGRVQALRYRVGIWPARDRVLLECEHCMMLADAERGTPPLALSLRPQEAGAGGTLRVRVSGRHGGRVQAVVHAGLVAECAHGAAGIAVMPPIREARVRPGEEFRFRFDVRLPPDLPAQVLHLKAAVLVNGALSWGMARLPVRAPDAAPAPHAPADHHTLPAHALD